MKRIATFSAIDDTPEITVDERDDGTYLTTARVDGEQRTLEENLFRAVAVLNAAEMWANGKWRAAIERMARDSGK